MSRPQLDAQHPRFLRVFSFLRTAEFWVAVIALATLFPVDAPPLPPELCLICGERGAADAIANVFLFLPLGFTLARRAGRYSRYLIPFGISFAIELAQHFLPGRNPSLADVVYNTMGGSLGIALGVHVDVWWNRAPRVARVWFALSVVMAASVLFLTAFLVAPAPTEDVYFGQWTARLGRLELYDGRVRAAAIGTESLPDGEVMNSAAVRAQIEQDATIRVAGVAGHTPRSLAPVLSLADLSQRQMFLLGIDRSDVVFHYRSRAVSLYLDHIEVRAAGLASDLRMGSPFFLEVSPGPRGLRFAASNRSELIAAPNLGMGWRMLAGSQHFPGWLRNALDCAWLFALFAPIGYWWRGGGVQAAAAAVPLLLLGGLPAVSWPAPTPAFYLVVALVSMALGALATQTLPPPVSAVREFS